MISEYKLLTNLSDVDQRVDRSTNVELDVRSNDPMISGENINLNFRAGDTLSEVEEWISGLILPIEPNFRGPIMTGLGKLNSGKVSIVNCFLPRNLFSSLSVWESERTKTFVDLVASVFDGCSIQIGGS